MARFGKAPCTSDSAARSLGAESDPIRPSQELPSIPYDVGMKATIEILDGLFDEAKARAAATGSTLRELVERGLRTVLAEPLEQTPYRLPDASVGGDGLAAGIGWDELLE